MKKNILNIINTFMFCGIGITLGRIGYSYYMSKNTTLVDFGFDLPGIIQINLMYMFIVIIVCLILRLIIKKVMKDAE